MRKKKNLMNRLLLVNCLTLLLTFGLIYLSVNHVIKDYVYQLTKTSMKANFSILDSLNQGQEIPDNTDKEQDSIFVWSYYATYSDLGQRTFTNEVKKGVSDQLYAYLSTKHLWQRAGKKDGILVTIGEQTYFVMTKTYLGRLQDGEVVKSASGSNQKFRVINFSDVTKTQKLIHRIHLFLLSILIATFSLMMLVVFKTFRDIRQSIHSVQTYISSLWRDSQSQKKQEELVFSDFDPLLQESQEMAARIQKAEASQAQFFQNASHELRTPLMSLQGYTEGLQTGIIPPETAYPVLMQESQKMRQLVDDILLLSRIDSRTEFKKDRLSLTDLLADMMAYFGPIAKQQDLVLDGHVEEEPFMIEGNAELLEKAFSNIVTNALRYAKSRIAIEEKQGTITISNDGPAISQADLPHVFERFYKGQGGQTGIGLAMAKEIILQHQGQISVTSDEKRTVFTTQL
ncbi:histidine kinase [Streptococcus penaeicida]|uniref:histidine kinase n=1 Tax=Streptococcus penaeicida TaxID=1765960 RepID=A0A2N8LAS3_9STRE|nr:histidine kinase [Streptococcus penaeicida]